ncbi:hypothetical protein C4D60_Mb08t21650 [Musa balbisiana]|uniref:Uncharacterized protein n=1 Tax=Musa balbisiana TaxID=52838 RepID=A0A4V4H939_MUSBA|nr:hypothetical protein C4D60_Mb08t21650 [Musa balbisiana]
MAVKSTLQKFHFLATRGSNLLTEPQYEQRHPNAVLPRSTRRYACLGWSSSRLLSVSTYLPSSWWAKSSEASVNGLLVECVVSNSNHTILACIDVSLSSEFLRCFASGGDVLCYARFWWTDSFFSTAIQVMDC